MQVGLEKTQLIQAYDNSLKTIWIMMCALSKVGLLVRLFINGCNLDQEHKTLQGLDTGKRAAEPEIAENNTHTNTALA
jgi:hypothetical protein